MSTAHLVAQGIEGKALQRIRTLLERDPLGVTFQEERMQLGQRFFSDLLPENTPPLWPKALTAFVEAPPWNYWEIERVSESLAILEESPERSLAALTHWSHRVGIGFDALFRPSPTFAYEERISLDRPEELLRLANEFHPEYLRRVEHIFSNLLTVFWAVLRNGSPQAKYRLPKAATLVKRKGHEALIEGYDDRLRNAIAHGEVVYKGLSIQYGPKKAGRDLASFEFLHHFDSIWRSSIALAISIIAFLACHQADIRKSDQLVVPASLMAFLVGAAVERPGLRVIGAVESSLPPTGRQLHVVFQTSFRSRELALFDSARMAMYLIANGASGYSRFLFNIDQGKPVSSVVAIHPHRLAALLSEDATVDRIGEIFSDTILLWYDESPLTVRFRSWRILLESAIKSVKRTFREDMQKAGLMLAAGRYRIKHIENVSGGDIARLRVTAVLRDSSASDDRGLVKEIIREIIKKVSRRLVNIHAGGLSRALPRHGFPKYIWVSLYRCDGTLRWLRSGGWAGGNLVAVGERIRGARQPVFVPNPEEIWKGIRLRYSIDQEAAHEATAQLATVVADIWCKRMESANGDDYPLSV